MTVFKLCLRLIRNNLPAATIYLAVFLGMAILSANMSFTPQDASYAPSRVPVAFFAPDGDPLAEALARQIRQTMDIIPIEDDEDTLLEALYFEKIQGVIRIPAGFTDSFLAGHHAQIDLLHGPNAGRSFYVEGPVARFMETVGLYRDFLPTRDAGRLVSLAEDSLAAKVPVALTVAESGSAVNYLTGYFNHLLYFNYQAYAMFAILILGISANLQVFNKRVMRMRVASSPLPSRTMSMDLFAANFAFALLCWAVMNVLSFVFAPRLVGSAAMPPLLLNSLLLSFWASSFSFLAAHLVKTRAGISGVANIAALGSSFLAGVFVPQELLGSGVLTVAGFTPAYWFVRANGLIDRYATAGNSGAALWRVNQIPASYLMQAGFGVAFLLIALLLRRQRAAAAGALQ